MNTPTNTTTTTKTNEVKKPKKEDNGGNKGGLIALFITLLLSLGAGGYLFYDNTLVKEQNQAQSVRIDSLITVKDKLLKDIDIQIEQLKLSQGENVELNGKLAEATEELEVRRIKINKLFFNHSKYNKLKKDYQTLLDEKEGYLKRIQELEELLAASKTENDQLKSNNLELNQQIGSLQDKNLSLEKQIQMASAMKTSNVLIIGEKKAKAGFVPTSLKKATRLLVTFDLIENKIAPSGPKEIYIKVTNPKGIVIENSESGTFTNPDNNIATPYTTMQSVNYNNTDQKVIVPIEIKKEEKVAGSYSLEFFCEGNLIGSKSISIK